MVGQKMAVSSIAVSLLHYLTQLYLPKCFLKVFFSICCLSVWRRNDLPNTNFDQNNQRKTLVINIMLVPRALLGYFSPHCHAQECFHGLFKCTVLNLDQGRVGVGPQAPETECPLLSYSQDGSNFKDKFPQRDK